MQSMAVKPWRKIRDTNQSEKAQYLLPRSHDCI
jgi:hypothetical protein